MDDKRYKKMEHVNKPLALRIRLNLSQTEAGMYVLEHTDPHYAQIFWSRLERQNTHEDCMSNHLRIIIKRVMRQIDYYGLYSVAEMLGIPDERYK